MNFPAQEPKFTEDANGIFYVVTNPPSTTVETEFQLAAARDYISKLDRRIRTAKRAQRIKNTLQIVRNPWASTKRLGTAIAGAAHNIAKSYDDACLEAQKAGLNIHGSPFDHVSLAGAMVASAYLEAETKAREPAPVVYLKDKAPATRPTPLGPPATFARDTRKPLPAFVAKPHQ